MMTINAEVIEQHGLTIEEYEHIIEKIGRKPNLTELGIISVMWSEHCSYKSSRKHLKKLPPRVRGFLSAPAKTQVSLTSATVTPRPSRLNRTITPALSSRSRARRRALAAFSATSSRWALARSR